MKTYNCVRIFSFVIAVASLGLFTACEQEHFEPEIAALPGGGTVTTYKAYLLTSSDPGGENIYGRVVFYKYSSTVTLVQMGLYNTDPDQTYAAGIYDGAVLQGSSAITKALDDVSGTNGAFVSSKYFVMNDAAFFDNLSDLDASVKVMLGASAVATGDIGANADPVAEQD